MKTTMPKIIIHLHPQLLSPIQVKLKYDTYSYIYTYLFIYLFKLISICPIQVHTMGMERVTFIIQPQAFTI
jgi:hypothetical protein